MGDSGRGLEDGGREKQAISFFLFYPAASLALSEPVPSPMVPASPRTLWTPGIGLLPSSLDLLPWSLQPWCVRYFQVLLTMSYLAVTCWHLITSSTINCQLTVPRLELSERETRQLQGEAKVGLLLWVYIQNTVYACIIIYYCMIFHTNNCTFAPPSGTKEFQGPAPFPSSQDQDELQWHKITKLSLWIIWWMLCERAKTIGHQGNWILHII